jgi:hypothetical protein
VKPWVFASWGRPMAKQNVKPTRKRRMGGWVDYNVPVMRRCSNMRCAAQKKLDSMPTTIVPERNRRENMS